MILFGQINNLFPAHTAYPLKGAGLKHFKVDGPFRIKGCGKEVSIIFAKWDYNKKWYFWKVFLTAAYNGYFKFINRLFLRNYSK